MRPVARKDNLIVQESGDEVLVYDLNKNKAISLNRTSALIWNYCDGKNSVSDIVGIVTKEFGEKVSEEFVLFAIDQLKRENMLNGKEEVMTGFSEMSRREVIKRIGFSSVIALPVVASLTAPLALHAQSCAAAGNGAMQSANGCPCVTGMDCMSGPGTCDGTNGVPQAMGGTPPFTCAPM